MMNKKEIFNKVGGIISELNEQYEYLSQSSENLNELELELFSANANFLSDHLAILVKLNQKSEKPEAAGSAPATDKQTRETKPGEAKETAAEQEEAHPENKKEELPQNEKKELSDWKFELEKEPDTTFEFEQKNADKLFDRPLTDEEKKVINEKASLKNAETPEAADQEPEEDAVEQEEAPVNRHEPEEIPDDQQDPEKNEKDISEEPVVKEVVISERTIAVPVEQSPETPVPTVNDLLSRNNPQQTVGSQFNSRQVRDLKSLINLNDKLLFVRDLFNGYSLAYSEAIELLNRFDSFEAADNFLKQNYSAKNHWADKQDVADKFYEILSRRFSK